MARQQLSIDIHGQVQGVGFRPLLYRLAIQYQQTGWVANTPAGVHLILQGAEEQQHLLLETTTTAAYPCQDCRLGYQPASNYSALSRFSDY